MDWSGFGLTGDTWAVIMLLVAAAVTVVMLLQRGDLAFAVVIVWSFAGIYAKQSPRSDLVGYTAAILAVLVTVLALVQLVWHRPAG
jgi:hypothetical protein